MIPGPPSLVLLLLLLFPLSLPAHAEITRAEFDFIIETVMEQYHDEFQRQQQRLSIVAAWDNDNVYANAWKMEDARGETGLVQVSGGFARHPDMTPDAFALVVCHEVGHHIAGPPKIWKFSAEGQADYFGASDCLRRLFSLSSGKLKDRRAHAPRVVRKACHEAFRGADDRTLCIRIAMAGATLATYFARKRQQISPKFATPDRSIAPRTILVATNPQCRLDTYFAAALCNTRNNSLLENSWLCRSDRAARPGCWFNRRH